MKRVCPIIFFIFFISLVFSGEGEEEKYTFIYNQHNLPVKSLIGNIETVRFSHEMSFTIPEIGFIKYSNQYIETIEFLGVEGKFWKYRATLTEIESDNYVNNIEIMDHYREAMEDNPCYIYVKSSGDDHPDHIVPIKEEDAYLQEAFEAAYMDIYAKNFRYPFGNDAVDVSVGDKWSYFKDSIRVYINMGSPPSLISSKSSYTFKKVKKKRGKKIAIIERQDSTMMEAYVVVDFLGERRLIAGQATGTTEMIFRWDIDAGKMLKVRVVSNLVGDFEMDGETFHMKVFQRNISTKVK